MRNEEAINVEAMIELRLEDGLFRVRLVNGHVVIAHCRLHEQEKSASLKIGDSVRLEMSPFDMSKGRILFL